jgi:heme-degrading monooxygenase HmoA
MTVYYSLPADIDWAAMRDMARHRAPLFEGIAPLRSKSWVIDAEHHRYGGHFVWESAEAAEDYLASDLFNGFLLKFGAPEIRTYEVVAYVEHGAVVPT